VIDGGINLAQHLVLRGWRGEERVRGRGEEEGWSCVWGR
jgi:hypothetical protein